MVTNRAVREANVTATGHLPRFPATDSCSHLNLPFRSSLLEQGAGNAMTICRPGRSAQSGDRSWSPGIARRRSTPSVGTAPPYRPNDWTLSEPETPGNIVILSPKPRAAPGASVNECAVQLSGRQLLHAGGSATCPRLSARWPPGRRTTWRYRANKLMFTKYLLANM